MRIWVAGAMSYVYDTFYDRPFNFRNGFIIKVVLIQNRSGNERADELENQGAQPEQFETSLKYQEMK